jgi:predicted ABC-type ATPase
MAFLYILAGPNGTGKTTFYSLSIKEGFIPANLPFLNIDLYTQSFGAYNEENRLKARQVYREKVNNYITNKEDFMIESNLAEQSDYDWIEMIKKHAYKVILYYLSTDDVEINVKRVKTRVLEGGHDVAESIVRHRYTNSLAYLKRKIFSFEEVYFIDNTSTTAKVYAHLNSGQIVLEKPDPPHWINEALSFVKRINKGLEKKNTQ